MGTCPYCGAIATEEEYISRTEAGTMRVRIRRCTQIRRGGSRATLKRDPNCQLKHVCGKVDILSSSPV